MGRGSSGGNPHMKGVKNAASVPLRISSLKRSSAGVCAEPLYL